MKIFMIGGTGLLCAPKDAQAYAESLAQLLDRPELRRALGRAARRSAEVRFDTLANHRRTVAIYDELLATADAHLQRRRAA